MKTKIYKALSVLLTLAMIFSACVSVVSADTTAQDLVVDGKLYPAMGSGSVGGSEGLRIENSVSSNSMRLYTISDFEAANFESVTVPSGARVFIQYFDANGVWKGGSGWKTTAGTYDIGYGGATYFKITYGSWDGSNYDFQVPSTEGFYLTLAEGYTEPEVPETPDVPDEPIEPDNSVKVIPEMFQGTIDKGVVNAAVTTRVNSDFIYVSDIKKVTIGSGYKAGYHFYDENATFINGHIGGWQLGTKTGEELAAMVNGATYVKIVVGKSNDSELYPETLTDDAIVISLADGLDKLTKPALPEVEPELPPLKDDPEVKINFSDYAFDRGNGLKNTFAKLNKGEEINVLYMGGSVTNGTGSTDYERDSWRALVSNWLAHNAGNGKVNNVNVAYGDTCTLFGSYRLNAEILPEEPDLIFVEFAINDMYNSRKRGYGEKESAMQFETIIRTIRQTLPSCDIVTILTADKGTFNSTTLHKYAQVHENISIAYNVPSIHVGRALAKEIELTGNSWSSTYAWTTNDIAHPNDLGHSVYAGPIKAYLNAQLTANGTSTTVTDHVMPEMVSDKLNDGDVKFIDADENLIAESEKLGGTGYAYGSGASNLAKSGTNVFKGGVLSKNEADKLFVKFTGTEISMIEYQPISGFKVSVDGGDFYTVTRDSVKPVVLAKNLENDEHTICIMPVFSSPDSPFHIQGFFTRDETKATHKHVYDHACDTTCNIEGCGFTRTTEHVYDHACDTECNVEGCGFTRTTEHVYENDCDTDCNVEGCGFTRTTEHVYDHACDTTCNVEGCGFTRTTEHVYDHACDTTCNIEGCGFTRTTEHSIKYHEETETTPCQSPGVKEHWYCENCMARFSDEEGTNEVEYDSLLKLDELTYQHDYDNEVDTDCNWCGMTREIVGTHIVADPETGAKYYYVNGVKSTATGLVEFEGKQMYINKGRFLGSSGLVTIGGKKMYINKGYFTGASGLVTISGKKTYINKGYFLGKSGLVTISGKKAYINKGYFTGASGIVTLNGKKMYISKGYFLGKSGLVTVGGKKAYINKGYFTGTTGIVTINGKKHYINKGYFTGASGKVKVGGKTYTVVKGIVK